MRKKCRGEKAGRGKIFSVSSVEVTLIRGKSSGPENCPLVWVFTKQICHVKMHEEERKMSKRNK
jgi:hypothetical protein